MQPISDRLRIAREKLAYLVDATAAPVATLALVSTWIGFQVGLIDEALGAMAGGVETFGSAYAVFINSLAFNFYPILTLVFIACLIALGRDLGPMARAETRARTTGALTGPNAQIGNRQELEQMQPKPGIQKRSINAWVPLAILVLGTLGGIYQTGVSSVGTGAPLQEIIGAGDSYAAMMWASLVAVLVAGAMTVGQRILSLGEVVDAWFIGGKAMVLAIVILVLAWALADINADLHTADYLVSIIGDQIDARLLPVFIFVLAALTAFATGSSWGVMGILIPLVVPLTFAALDVQGLSPHHTSARVLRGGVRHSRLGPTSWAITVRPFPTQPSCRPWRPRVITF